MIQLEKNLITKQFESQKFAFAINHYLNLSKAIGRIVREKLYKVFNAAIIALKSQDYMLAKNLLADIEYSKMGPAAKDLYSALSKAIPDNFATKPLPYTPNGFLAEYDSRVPIPGTSLVSCCMNRNENLKQSLHSWIKLPVDEIVIVDWSSKTPVAETIADIKDDRIKILRVEGEPRWVLTYGFNVGLRFASYSKVYKLDADIRVNENFLEKNNFDSQSFIRGSWKSALESGANDQIFVNGSFGCGKEQLLKIGFYNELIRTYGWDDSDLYERLSHECGLKQRFLCFDSLYHLEQEADDRTRYQNVTKCEFLGKVPATEFNNYRNRYIGRTTEYWNSSRLQNYSIQKTDNNLWACSRVTHDINLAEFIINDANSYAAMHYIWRYAPSIFTATSNNKTLSGFIYFLYQAQASVVFIEKLFGLNGSTIDSHFFNDHIENIFSFSTALTNDQNESAVFMISDKNIYKIKNIGQTKIHFIGTTPDQFNELQKRIATTDAALYLTLQLPHETILSTLNNQHIPKVYVDAQHGLGNRLRAIASAAAIAQKSGRELVIVWEPDHHCECDFHDLFEYSGAVLRKSLLQEANQTMCVYNYMEIEPGACKDAEIIIDPARDLYLRAAYTFKSPLSDWNSENAFLRNLQPSRAVLNLTETFDLNNAIAAHIRMEAGAGLDHNTYDSVENWTQEGHDLLHYWRDKSHFSHFIKRVDQILSENPNQKLFLATDLPETYRTFENYYGDKLVYLKRNAYDRSREQIIYALADAILLSRCQKLLGSTWSSFSELAMRLSTTYSEIEMSGRDF